MQTRTAQARAQTFAWGAAHGIRDAAQQSVDHFARAIAFAKAAGADSEKLEDLRILLLDEIFPRIQGDINRTLSDNGVTTYLHQIDTRELRDEPHKHPWPSSPL